MALAVASIILSVSACGKDEEGAPGPVTRRVSVGPGGAEATGGISGVAAISADGRITAFTSEATNLVADDTNGLADVFVHDAATGLTTRVSTASDGSQGTGGSSRNPVLSADGRYVVFESDATNLVAGDTNGLTDIFLRDRQTGQTTRVSVDGTGGQGNGPSFGAAISADGTQIAFASAATNLVLGDTNNLIDIFVYDRSTNPAQTTRISVGPAGAQAVGPAGSTNPSLSADGRFVAYASAANNLVANDTNNQFDVFRYDRIAGVTIRVSVDSNGAQAAGGLSESPSVSSDGSLVAFRSTATNLVSNDTNNAADVFVKELSSGQTSRVSVDGTGAQANGASTVRDGGMSADGRFVVFQSSANNLVAGDGNGVADVFVRDRTTGLTTRQSVNSAGAEATGGASDSPVISGNGTVVAFDSFATNLVATDSNNLLDVFLATRR